jgi:NadR type nicotinamide-nucleotide adenylyltransferase
MLMKAFSPDSTVAPKIVTILGPECTGKTDLSKFLADQYQTEWVPEYARAYLDKLGRPYRQEDLTKIAHGQVRLEDEWIQSAHRVLFCDTNLIVLKVWSESKFGNCDPGILQLMQTRHYDLILLTHIDVPWENDPQREQPAKREHFWNIYKKESSDSGIPVVEISGDRDARRALAIQAVEQLLAKV